MKPFGFSASLGLAAALGGCTSVVSVRPLYTKAEAAQPYLDERIEKEWVMAGIDEAGSRSDAVPPCRVSVTKESGGEFPYAVTFRCAESANDLNSERTEYELHLVRLKGSTFFDARVVEHQKKDKTSAASDLVDQGAGPLHVLGQVWIQPDFLRYSSLGNDWVEQDWPKESLEVTRIRGDDKMDILTNPTADLRELLVTNAGSQKAFSVPFYLCRETADCNLMAAEDQLTRTPDDKGVLAESERFFAGRGNFSRAIALQRHKIDLESDSAADQLELGRLLLLGRDFEGARRALAVAKEPPQRPSIRELVVLSHFLQGDYVGVVQAEKTLSAPANLVSADPILLSYFAQHRLGQDKEAESYLGEQMAAFSGAAQEHLYLLQTSGRVTDAAANDESGRKAYYYALGKLKAGEPKAGRGHLEDLARMLPKDNLIGLAARVELERLETRRTK